MSQDLENILNQIPEENSSVDDSYSDDFIELSSLGYLTSEVNYCGHKFVLRTLRVGEEIVAGRIIKNDEASVSGFKATMSVVVAASLVTVDGMPFMPPLGENDIENNIRQRYKYITTNWYFPIIDFLATEHNKLVQRQAEAIVELQKKSSGGLTTL